MGQTDKQKLINLYQEKIEEIRFFIRSRVKDAGVAEDLTQDLYLRLNAIKEPTVVDNIPGYLFRMAHNISSDHLRLEKRQQFLATDIAKLMDTFEGGRDPRFGVDAKLELEQIQNQLSSLPERCRKIFLLNRIEGLTHKEIAARFGITTRAVEKNIKKALEHCLRDLEP